MISFKPYDQIRGFNYTPSTARNDVEFWRNYDEALVERELTYAQRLGLNSARVFLSYVVYEQEPQVFLDKVRRFVRTAFERGITTMAVIWDSCFSEVFPTYDIESEDWVPNPGVQRLGSEFWPKGEQYCKDLVKTLAQEPGLAIWDVMNEPTVTSYVQGPGLALLRNNKDEAWIKEHIPNRKEHLQEIWDFVHHFCIVMGNLDSEHPTTVGVHRASLLKEIGDDVDLLSFHDYGSSRGAIRANIKEALGYTENLEKPLLVSEMGCLARANPYDVTLEIFREHGIGWYLWELMIGASRWRDIHGVVYPDGTVRDPAIVAAIQGFFRKRSGDIVPANVDKEGAATRVLNQANEWLCAGTDYTQGLAILEVMANLLEAGEHVPMCEPPSVKVLPLADETLENRAEMNRLIVRWSDILEHHSGRIREY